MTSLLMCIKWNTHPKLLGITGDEDHCLAIGELVASPFLAVSINVDRSKTGLVAPVQMGKHFLDIAADVAMVFVDQLCDLVRVHGLNLKNVGSSPYPSHAGGGILYTPSIPKTSLKLSPAQNGLWWLRKGLRRVFWRLLDSFEQHRHPGLPAL